MLDQPCNPVRQRPRLAGPRASNHQRRPLPARDCGKLLLVEFAPIIDVQVAPTVCRFENVFLRHRNTSNAANTRMLRAAINPAGMNLRVFAKRAPISTANTAARIVAHKLAGDLSRRIPKPRQMNATPKTAPEISDGTLRAFAYPITPPTNTSAP